VAGSLELLLFMCWSTRKEEHAEIGSSGRTAPFRLRGQDVADFFAPAPVMPHQLPVYSTVLCSADRHRMSSRQVHPLVERHITQASLEAPELAPWLALALVSLLQSSLLMYTQRRLTNERSFEQRHSQSLIVWSLHRGRREVCVVIRRANCCCCEWRLAAARMFQRTCATASLKNERSPSRDSSALARSWRRFSAMLCFWCAISCFFNSVALANRLQHGVRVHLNGFFSAKNKSQATIFGKNHSSQQNCLQSVQIRKVHAGVGEANLSVLRESSCVGRGSTSARIACGMPAPGTRTGADLHNNDETKHPSLILRCNPPRRHMYASSCEYVVRSV